MSSLVNRTNFLVIFGISVIGFLYFASVESPLDQAVPETNATKAKRTLKVQDKGYIKRLPQAIIIGAKKSGTSALRTFLRDHPDIQMTWHEPHFFCNYTKFIKGMDCYKNEMPRSLPYQITIEKTPCYFVNASVPHLVHKHLGKNMKFILILRDPVQRIHSDYNVSKKKPKWKNTTLEELVFIPNSTRVNTNADLVKISSYDDNLKRWLQYYPLDKFCILENKDLASNPVKTLQQIEDFLGVNRYFTRETISVTEELTWKKKRVYNYMSNHTRRILTDYLRPHSLNFFKIVNRTFKWQLHYN